MQQKKQLKKTLVEYEKSIKRTMEKHDPVLSEQNNPIDLDDKED